MAEAGGTSKVSPASSHRRAAGARDSRCVIVPDCPYKTVAIPAKCQSGRATSFVARPLFEVDWGGWIRTTDLLINSQALCQLSYTPSTAEAVTQFDEAVAP